MKIVLVLLLIGFSSASLQEDLQHEATMAVETIINGFQSATPLHIALGVEDSQDVQRLETDIKEELRKHIEEAFERALKKIEDAIAQNKNINEGALKMLKDLKEKMKDLNIEDHEVTEELDALKKKINDHLKQILEKMGVFDRRSTDPEMPELMQGILGDISIKEYFFKLKNMILQKLNVKSFRDLLAKIIGKATQRLCEWVTTKGREKVLNLFNFFLELGPEEDNSEVDKRATDDHYEEFKAYMRNIEENMDDKLAKFKKWLHDLLGKSIDEAKEKLQKVAKIIKEIIADSKNESKKGLVHILEHLREFEEKYGSLNDLRNVIQEFLRKKD